MKPGAIAGDLWDLTEREFQKQALVYPWGTIGHSTGLSVHEGFEISKGSPVALEPGMIINIEPSHIEAGDARYHIEDTFVITETGKQLLSSFTDIQTMCVIE